MPKSLLAKESDVSEIPIKIEKTLKTSKGNRIKRAKQPVEIFKSTMIGCLIEYLRKEGPKTFRALMIYIASQKPSLRSISGKKYKGEIYKSLEISLRMHGIFELNEDFE